MASTKSHTNTNTTNSNAKRELPFPINLYSSAIGKKYAMAITGIMLLGFVFAHMLGNLKLYIGIVQEDGTNIYDADVYAEFLRNLLVPIFPETVFLWILRLGLILAVVIHIHSAYSLTRLNLASNEKYESKRDWIAVNFAGRTMKYSGLIVLFYILFHLADLTLGWVPGYEWHHGAVQSNVVASLSNPIVALLYIVANILLTIHIFHGIYSMFTTIGFNNPKFAGAKKIFARGFALLILVGNISFPIAVLADVIEYKVCDETSIEVTTNKCIAEEDSHDS